MASLWTTVFYQPLFNLLVAIYNLVGGDMGLAIIGLTCLIKLVLYPLSRSSLKSQRALQELQPKVEELKTKFKDSKEKLAQELMRLYQQEKVSPLSSCLPLLIQLPFLIALYQVFGSGLRSGDVSLVYPFIYNPGHLSDLMFGMFSLSRPSWVLALVTAATQYWQAKMLVTKRPPIATPAAKDETMVAAMNKQALYVMPVLTLVFGLSLPSGLILYWLVNIIFTVVQQYLTFRHHGPKPAVS